MCRNGALEHLLGHADRTTPTRHHDLTHANHTVPNGNMMQLFERRSQLRRRRKRQRDQ